MAEQTIIVHGKTKEIFCHKPLQEYMSFSGQKSLKYFLSLHKHLVSAYQFQDIYRSSYGDTMLLKLQQFKQGKLGSDIDFYTFPL